jgi:tetratricopeptide (TPR) repeat protein
LNSNNTAAYKGRGAAYLSLGKNQEAINDFDESIRLNPNDKEVYQQRREAYAKLVFCPNQLE